MPLILAVVNTPNESLEITRWVNAPEDEIRRIENQMLTLVRRLYPRLSRADRRENQRTMVAVGHSDEESEPDDLKERKGIIRYALYEGRCLDPKGLSYFIPERTIEEGNLTLKEARKILAT